MIIFLTEVSKQYETLKGLWSIILITFIEGGWDCRTEWKFSGLLQSLLQ